MKIAVEYLRASTDMQDNSVGDQHTYNENWAQRNGYKIIKSYTDDGISGAKAAKRPSFLSMIDDAERGEWDAVLVYDSSRFARNLMEFLAYKKILQENGVQLIAVTEPMIDSDMSLFYDAINGASNEMYLRKLSRDVSRGILEMVKRGCYVGRPAFGYEKKPWNDNYTIVEEEAKWVRYIFEAVRDRVRYADIMNTLRQNGVKQHSGNDFDMRAIYRLVKIKIYKGYFDYSISGQNLVDIKVVNAPSIVSEELWNAANGVLNERSRKNRKNSKPYHIRQHWLSGRVVCGCCGTPMTYNSMGGVSSRARFQCKGYTKGTGCTTSTKAENVESLVIDEMRRVFSAPATEIIKNVTAIAPKSDIDFDGEISKLKAQLTRAKKAYLAEVDTLEEYGENKKRLTARIDELEQKKAGLTAAPVVDIDCFRNKLVTAVDLLDSDAKIEDKMEIANNLIDRVVVDTKRKTLELYFFA